MIEVFSKVLKKGMKAINNPTNNTYQIDSSTIDGKVEFVHSQYSFILTSQLSTQFLCPSNLLIIVIISE